MVDAGRAGIGKVVMRTKQHLAAIRPIGDALAMSTMRFADEVVDADDVEGVPSGKAKADAPSPKEKALAKQIIDALASDWEPSRYHDTYTDQVKDLIQAKAKGKELVVEDAPEGGADILDLMAALEASLAASKRGTAPTTKKAATKKTTAKKATKKAPAKKAS
jgi:DNA end-binding protein Ku